nr:DUF3592 domain-containing protein [Corallococcus exiguus]
MQSASWPSVEGTVTRSEVERRGSNKGTTVRLKLAYTYSGKSGHYDLRLHAPSRSLSLPPVSGRRHRLDLRWRDVRSLRVGPRVSSGQVGHLHSYPVTLEHDGVTKGAHSVALSRRHGGTRPHTSTCSWRPCSCCCTRACTG